MSKTLELAVNKMTALPEDMQEQLGREVLLRLKSLNDLSQAIAEGNRELDAGLGVRLSTADVIARARKLYVDTR